MIGWQFIHGADGSVGDQCFVVKPSYVNTWKSLNSGFSSFSFASYTPTTSPFVNTNNTIDLAQAIPYIFTDTDVANIKPQFNPTTAPSGTQISA